MELLHNLGIHTEWVQHNARPGTLYDEALRYEKGSAILSTGALAAFSGALCGRVSIFMSLFIISCYFFLCRYYCHYYL